MSTQLSKTSDRTRQESHFIQAVLAGLVALLILFLWLHFLLAQDIESIGRDITARKAELDRMERQNQALIRQITLVEAQQDMADRAWALGFRPQQPLYLAVNRPLVAKGDSGAFLSLRSLDGAGGAEPGLPVDWNQVGNPVEGSQNVAGLP